MKSQGRALMCLTQSLPVACGNLQSPFNWPVPVNYNQLGPVWSLVSPWEENFALRYMEQSLA